MGGSIDLCFDTRKDKLRHAGAVPALPNTKLNNGVTEGPTAKKAVAWLVNLLT